MRFEFISDRFSDKLADIISGPIFGLLPINAVFTAVSMFDLEQVMNYVYLYVSFENSNVPLYHFNRPLVILTFWCFYLTWVVSSALVFGHCFFAILLIQQLIKSQLLAVRHTTQIGMIFHQSCEDTLP